MTINPHFNSTGSCLFFSPCSSSASFHTVLASPGLSFLHLSSSSSLPSERCFLTVSLSRLVMSACASVVLNSFCIHTHLCFKSPLPDIFSLPRFLSAVHGVQRCCRCKEILAIICCPHSVKLLSVAAGSRAAQGAVCGVFRGRHKTTEVQTPSLLPCSFLFTCTVWSPLDDLQRLEAAARRFPGRSFHPAQCPVLIYVSPTPS